MPREDGGASQIAAALPALATHRVGAFAVEIWCGGVDESRLWTCRSTCARGCNCRGRRGESECPSCGGPKRQFARRGKRGGTGRVWRERPIDCSWRLFRCGSKEARGGGRRRRGKGFGRTGEHDRRRTRRAAPEGSEAEGAEATRRQCAEARRCSGDYRFDVTRSTFITLHS